MGKKFFGCLLIYLSSFSFFTGIFHALANANIYADTLAVPIVESTKADIFPTPTIFYGPTRVPTPVFFIPTATPLPSPTLLPSPVQTIATSTDIESLFVRFSEEYNVDKEFLKKIARCESGFNPQADAGLYKGMFQFAEQTWISVRASMGLDTNPDLRMNGEESIRTAAYLISKGGQNAWVNCIK